MTSSKPAYFSPNKEIYHNSSLRPANMDNSFHKASLARDSKRTEANRILEEIKNGKDRLLSQVYPAHRNAIQSIRQTDDHMHLLFILYAIQTLECDNEDINGTTIYKRCIKIENTLSTHFNEDLFQLFPSIEDGLDAHAATSSGVPCVDAAGATNFATTPSNEAAVSLPIIPSTPPRRTPEQDFVDGLSQGGGQTNPNASSSVVQDVPDNISFSTRSAAPVEPTINSLAAKPEDESLLGATASSLDIASFRIPVPKEGSQQKSGDSRADSVRHVKECLWAVQHENKILETYKQCIQCKKNPRDITFLPCGHFITCRQCAGPIFTCMLCNRAILATIDTYLS